MVTVTLAVVGDMTLCSLVKVFISNVPSLTKPHSFTFRKSVIFFDRCSFYIWGVLVSLRYTGSQSQILSCLNCSSATSLLPAVPKVYFADSKGFATIFQGIRG